MREGESEQQTQERKLAREEYNLVQGALQLRTKCAKDVMISMDKVFMLIVGDVSYTNGATTLSQAAKTFTDAVATEIGHVGQGAAVNTPATPKFPRNADDPAVRDVPAAMVAARGGSLKDAWDAVREECDPKFADYAIYEHCLPFNVARAFDEAKGIDTPRIWTAERDLEMWNALQNG